MDVSRAQCRQIDQGSRFRLSCFKSFSANLQLRCIGWPICALQCARPSPSDQTMECEISRTNIAERGEKNGGSAVNLCDGKRNYFDFVPAGGKCVELPSQINAVPSHEQFFIRNVITRPPCAHCFCLLCCGFSFLLLFFVSSFLSQVNEIKEST